MTRQGGRRRYADELALLPRIYSGVRGTTFPALEEWVAGSVDRPALFVASGGALAAAHLAADMHTRVAGQIARAVTPLQLLSMGEVRRASLLLLTAGGRHPDSSNAAAMARAIGLRPFGILTLRALDELTPELAKFAPWLIPLPRFSAEREGFLATGSVMTMAVALAAAYFRDALPRALNLNPAFEPLRSSALALWGPGEIAGAVDLETRMSELGLAHVQVSDYRNFAHGRHTGLDRNMSSTTLVAFISPETSAIAEATLGVLPPSTEVLRITSKASWPASVLEHIAATINIADATAREHGVEASRPKVPRFGRSLYHLRALRTSTPAFTYGPVERKVTAAGGSFLDKELHERYSDALKEWLSSMKSLQIGAIVLDYDGTCCETEQRFDPTPKDVRNELLRILDADIPVAFASGRGKSLPKELQSWIPRENWERTFLGLYNGGLVVSLADEIPKQEECGGDLLDLAERIQRSPLGHYLKVEKRTAQLTVHAASGTRLASDSLRHAISEIAQRTPSLNVRITGSAHSIDVVPTETSKARVVELMTDRFGDVLAIGDQGQLQGNDFELLASTRYSLTVDQCSADPTRCWNLANTSDSGPALLVRYLKGLKTRRGRARFAWRGDGHGFRPGDRP